jgi:hypothetical protein
MKMFRGSEITQFGMAGDFQEAYRRCFRPDSKDGIVSIPGFVNGFFACEIYLKILLNNKKKGHDLYELFNALNDEYKKKISAFYVAPISENISFDEFLLKVNSGFEYWRYIYGDNNKKFEENYPFLYSEIFLGTFLPVFEEMAKEHLSLSK